MFLLKKTDNTQDNISTEEESQLSLSQAVKHQQHW